MKKLIYNVTLATGLLVGLSGCVDTFLDLNPQDKRTDVVYFQKASDFKEYMAGCYGQLMGWNSPYGGNSVYDYMDFASDLSVYSDFSYDVGHGTIKIPTSDKRWDKSYEFIRTVNTLFDKAKEYPGNQEEIAPYMAEAYFFRANAYFNLLKFFGGVPLVLTVMDTNSSDLRAPRNSRYEVVDQILSDLQAAIDDLPVEQEIAAGDKGRISKWAAMAMKARVLLYEATWRKYNGVETDFEGSGKPERDQVNEFLEESASLSKQVIENGGYALWNYNENAMITNKSNYYLFNLEDEGSNPAGLTKETNKEFILYGVYDYVLRQGGQNLTRTVGNSRASRKLADMFVCTDGLPISRSPLFQGFHSVPDEYMNRDLRMVNYFYGAGSAPATSPTLAAGGFSGYPCAKFSTAHANRKETEESANYPVIRLAEVYLNYAEASCELLGDNMDDAVLKGLNEIRKRAGVAGLSKKLVKDNNLDMLTEIRRERTVELFMEGFRFDDLKRWGIAEKEINASHCGAVVGDASYKTDYVDESGNPTKLYTKNLYPYGEEEVEIETKEGKKKYTCVVIDGAGNFRFSKMNYLWPIPQDQIELNSNLKQNPGYN